MTSMNTGIFLTTAFTPKTIKNEGLLHLHGNSGYANAPLYVVLRK